MFPTTSTLLCRWHISKNVLAKCKKLFDRKDTWGKFLLSWNLVVFASTKDEYERHLYALTLKYHAYEGTLNYVRNTWLNNKEKFVIAWTNRIMYFGTLLRTGLRVHMQS